LYIRYANTVCLGPEARLESRDSLEFSDAERVSSGPTLTYVDDRFDYVEERFVTLGLLREIVVSIVHTESRHEIRIISFRKATRRESAIFFESIEYPPRPAGDA
jgi:uncharacterized DUF497 family protein